MIGEALQFRISTMLHWKIADLPPSLVSMIYFIVEIQESKKKNERLGSWHPAFPSFIKLSIVWWWTFQIALHEVIITKVSRHFSTVLLDWTDLKENLMKQLSVKWLYSVVDVFSTVFITLTAFLFYVSPFIYQCNYRRRKKFCWNPLFSPLSTASSFSNWHYFYIPWLSINSSKRKSLFQS